MCDINEEIIMQTGSTDFSTDKDNIKVYKYLPPEQFAKYLNEATQIITHAGVGTLVQGLKLNKKMIVAPRLKKYKEHVNDHQLQILKTFEESGYIIPLYDFNDLDKKIKEDFKPNKFESNNESFIDNLNKEIKMLIKQRGEK